MRPKWFAAAAVLAVACVGLMVRHARVPDALAPILRLAADAKTRPTEARLAGFPHRRIATRQRGHDREELSLRRLRFAAGSLADDLHDVLRAEAAHVGGVAALIGLREEAIERLRAAVDAKPGDARYWNDLAAALYTRGRAEVDPHDLVHALDAADRALQIAPQFAEAAFNRALILEALSLRQHAAGAWLRYQTIDATSPWAEEARSHMDYLRERGRRERWADERAALDQPRGGDATLLTRLVDEFPEETRRLGEATLLAEWADSFLAGNVAAAESRLADVRRIGARLLARNGDAFLGDAVAAIDRCESQRCRVSLAETHRLYDRARREYRDRKVSAALPMFLNAAERFRAAHSAMAFVAEYYAANCLEDKSDATALERLQELRRVVPVTYRTLHAQLNWETGTVLDRTGRLVEALDSYDKARAIFSVLGERNNFARMLSSAASANSRLGRSAEAWRQRAAAFASISEAANAEALQAVLELAARMEAMEEHWGAAISLFTLAIEPPFDINPRVHVSALLWRALATERTGDAEKALLLLGEARRALRMLEDVSLRETASDDIRFAVGSVLSTTDPVRAAEMLDRFIERSHERQRFHLLAEAHLQRARAARRIGQTESAEAHFRSALAEIDARRSGSAERGISDAYFAAGIQAACELAGLLVSQGRYTDAFEAIEAARGRALRDRLSLSSKVPSQSAEVEQIRLRLPDHAVVVSYLLLPDRAIAFTLRQKRGLETWTLSTTAGDVRRRIADLRNAIAHDREQEADGIASQLDRDLIEPLSVALEGANHWFIVSDPVMEPLPFSVLRSRYGRCVIERAVVIHSPSASLLARSLASHRGGKEEPGAVLIVGNPSFDSARFAGLALLPAAEREARQIARLYENPVVLTGRDATAARIMNTLASSRIVHIAVHAMTSRNDPMRSMLLAAPSGAHSGIVYAGDVAASEVSADVVVLAGCRTAATSETPSDVGSLSLAFLLAGARNVVGTQWNVDDEDTAAFSYRLHTYLIRGIPVADAARLAQLDLMRERPLRSWSAFTTTGSGD